MPSLRTLLARPPIVVTPGCYDALSALMIERAGFPAAYFSGASLAYTRFGRPDIGLVAAGSAESPSTGLGFAVVGAAVVGRAALEGKLDLRAAISAFASQR